MVSSMVSVFTLMETRLFHPPESGVIVSETLIPRSFAMNSAFTMLMGTWRMGSRRPFKAMRVIKRVLFPSVASSPL
ncbi:MAG: hypothetical protein A4E37_00185 [Methanoregulaceae archaeon PtaB.Bin056]|nr:MAG: hypothetical protein A4E37_00185 [Methanoregulaceae archaeon PtaB.Bin056]